MSNHRRGRLSKVEKFYIDKNYGKIDIETIADDLNRTVEQVQKYILDQKEEKANEVTKRKNRTQFEKSMISDPKKGVAIMTEGASQIADENRPNYQKNQKYHDAIRPIK